jgi:transposase
LGRDSDNFSQPPSGDPPWKRPDERTSGRKRGGQLGHRGHKRERLETTEVVNLKPSRCSGCGEALSGNDNAATWHQVIEIPEVRPHVTEYRFHRLSCTCGAKTSAPWPAEVPRGGFGPRIQAFVATCSGAYHLSKRNTQELLKDFFGVPLSLGNISNLERATSAALEPVYAEAMQCVRSSLRANIDETTWLERASRCYLWTVRTPRVTLFSIHERRSQEVVRELLRGFGGIIGTDGYNGYHFMSQHRRQFCWAHLIRQFRGLLLYDEEERELGQKLLSVADRMFQI